MRNHRKVGLSIGIKWTLAKKKKNLAYGGRKKAPQEAAAPLCSNNFGARNIHQESQTFPKLKKKSAKMYPVFSSLILKSVSTAQ